MVCERGSVFTLCVALDTGWELRRDDIGTESVFLYHRGPLIRYEYESWQNGCLTKWSF